MAEAAIAADRAHADPAIWILRCPDEAILANARALEAKGPRGHSLWGVPFAVKVIMWSTCEAMPEASNWSA